MFCTNRNIIYLALVKVHLLSMVQNLQIFGFVSVSSFHYSFGCPCSSVLVFGSAIPTTVISSSSFFFLKKVEILLLLNSLILL